MSSIYGLYDPCDTRVGYIGKTTKPLYTRLGEHIAEARRSKNGGRGEQRGLNLWIMELIGEGVLPLIRLLETCDEDLDSILEKEWIANTKLLPHRLVNGTEGGEGGRHTPEVRAKMSAAHKALWEDETYRANQTTAFKERRAYSHTPEATYAKQSATMKDLWANPDFRAKMALVHKPYSKNTHCKHGHEFTPENTYVNAKGYRTCKTCSFRRTRERRQRLAAAKETQS